VHAAGTPPRSEELSPPRTGAFPGRAQWKEEWLPSDCRDTGSRLGVAAHAHKESVEVRLVFSPQRAPELFPVFRGLLNQLNESRDGSAHNAPQSFRSGEKQRSILLAGKGKLVLGSGFHLHDVVGLVAKSLKEIAPLGLKRCGVRKNGNGKGEGRDVTETFERMFKGSPRFSFPNVLIEIEVRQGRDDEHVGRKFLQSLRHTSNQFGKLKTSKGARDANEPIYGRRVNTAFSRETR